MTAIACATLGSMSVQPGPLVYRALILPSHPPPSFPVRRDCYPAAAGMGGSATASRRPISSGFYPPLSSPLGQPNFAGTGGAPSVQLRSPPPAYAGTTGGLGSPSLRHGIASPLARFSFTGASLGATAAGGEPAAPPSAPSPSIGVTAAQLEALLGQLQLQAAQLAAEKARNASLEARLSALEQSAPAPAQQPSAPSEPSATPAAAAVAETGSQ